MKNAKRQKQRHLYLMDIIIVAMSVALTIAMVSEANAQDCKAEVINVTDDAWDATSWFSINDSGDLAGNYCAQSSACEGWDSEVGGAIYDGATGAIETFSAPDGYNVVQMVGMNERGVVVGTAVAGDGSGGIAGAAAFLYKDGVSKLIDDPLGTGYWAATDINASGTIIGYSRTGDGSNGRIGWALSKRGNVTLIEVDGAVRTFPFAINSRGDIAGYFLHQYGYVGGFVLPKNGAMELLTDVAEPPFNEFYLYGINNDGTVVGQYVRWSASFDFLGVGAFIREEGKEIASYNVLDYDDTSFTSINDSGAIAGTAAGMTDGLLVESCE